MLVETLSLLYSLRKVKRFFHQAYRRYRRRLKYLDPIVKEKVESQLSTLKTAIIQKDLPIAKRIAAQLDESLAKHLPKSSVEKGIDFLLSIGFALLVAVFIRTIWFEFYSIPSGSMRPTLKEGDVLLVTKTDFGINVPLKPAHFYFDPSLIERGAVTVFAGNNMDIDDPDTMYFYLFPGKKLFVKRLIGKPGDTLYFYGGKVYGIDRQGRDLKPLREAEWAKNLEHIPFIRFDGKVETSEFSKGMYHESYFYQMNKPVAKLYTTPIGTVYGEMIGDKSGNLPSQYSDLWGFKHFAMTRLLTKEELNLYYPKADVEPGTLYLEIAHHPSLQGANMTRDEHNRLRPDLGFNVSILPLNNAQIEELAHHLITCRFVVKNGSAYRFGMKVKNPSELPYLPKLPDVEDGMYEIQDGKAYKVGFGGITTELASNHPLYRTDAQRVQLLYNLGIEFLTYYGPTKNGKIYPSRYSYFRNHDLYLCGSPIVKKDDPNLIVFLKKEYQKQSISTSIRPYTPFDDAGAPVTSDGKIDADFIRKNGLVVPDKMYLMLGDNHAMSADSRQFGFVPEDNLRGGPSRILWPFGSRLGELSQASISHLTFPNLFVWTVAISIGLASSYYTRRKFSRITFNKKDPHRKEP